MERAECRVTVGNHKESVFHSKAPQEKDFCYDPAKGHNFCLEYVVKFYNRNISADRSLPRR